MIIFLLWRDMEWLKKCGKCGRGRGHAGSRSLRIHKQFFALNYILMQKKTILVCMEWFGGEGGGKKKTIYE